MFRLIRSLVVIVSLLISASAAMGVQVQVDPGSYVGIWKINGETNFVSGAQTVSLDPGTYAFYASIFGNFTVTVAADETVSVANGVSAVGGVGEITFNTVTVTVDPGSYTGPYSVAGVASLSPSASSVELVPGTGSGFYLGGVSSSGNGFFFKVAADSSVQVTNGVSGVGGVGTLLLNTVPTWIDPGAFAGEWKILGIREFATGASMVHLVPGVRQAMTVASVGQFFFAVLGDRTVFVHNGVSAIGAFESLTFSTFPILVDPNGFPGDWNISRVQSATFGSAIVDLVPEIHYFSQVGAGNTGAGGNFFFDVLADGSTVASNGISTIGTPGTMTFNTVDLYVQTNWPATWSLMEVMETTGDASVSLVAGLTYFLQPGNQAVKPFTVTDPCSVSPPDFDYGAYDFHIDCGAPDGDGDGAPDATDNCPVDANADQLDQDQDGVGDVCDADLDGDGLSNTLDNCPAVDNVDQADLDGDGQGDACDADSDGDSIPNGADNCPVIANTDQADSDADQLGDVCDADDDGDGFDDVIDNCPLAANADQLDFDGDGEGDACDGDIDSDGVANEIDLCPESPAAEPVDASGCNAAQMIALQCVRTDFVQHGQYVSCVAHAAQDAVDLGLIAKKDKRRFVEAAAHSD